MKTYDSFYAVMCFDNDRLFDLMSRYFQVELWATSSPKRVESIVNTILIELKKTTTFTEKDLFNWISEDFKKRIENEVWLTYSPHFLEKPAKMILEELDK